MSVNKLVKYLQQQPALPEAKREFTPVIVSDSKGRWLQKTVQTPTDKSIKWWTKGGVSTQEELSWLATTLPHKAQKEKLWLYLWTAHVI